MASADLVDNDDVLEMLRDVVARRVRSRYGRDWTVLNRRQQDDAISQEIDRVADALEHAVETFERMDGR